MIGRLNLAERHDVVGAVDGARRGDQQVAHLEGARRLQDVEGPHQVRIDIGPGVLQAVANAGLSGEMHDHIRPVGLRGRLQPCGVLYVEHLFGEGVAALEDRVPRVLQAHIVVRREGVDADHLDPRIDELSGQVKADEPGGPGNQNPHWLCLDRDDEFTHAM